jgi:uncharacterized membrane protein (UPF0127 family)
MRKARITNITNPSHPTLELVVCSSMIHRFRGLMFHQSLKTGEGAIFIGSQESIIQSAIHMFFMKLDIFVLWVDGQWQIVDTSIAKRGHPYYAPCTPALYIIETTIDQASNFKTGEQLSVVYA